MAKFADHLPFHTLIAPAKINDVEPFAYLNTAWAAIADGHPASRIDELLPWNFTRQADRACGGDSA